MSKINPKSIAAYVLAGGESRRFGGNKHKNSKGLQSFDGRPLISHTIDKLNSQLDTVNINTHLPGFSEFNCTIVSDNPNALYQGPLSGLLASMRHAEANYIDKEWLLLAPCDSPFLPQNLTNIFINNVDSQKHSAACISYQTELQPTFSLWHKTLLTNIEEAVMDRQWGGLKIFFKSLDKAGCVIEYPEQAQNPFLNINNREELEQAEQLARQLTSRNNSNL